MFIGLSCLDTDVKSILKCVRGSYRKVTDLLTFGGILAARTFANSNIYRTAWSHLKCSGALIKRTSELLSACMCCLSMLQRCWALKNVARESYFR